VQSQVARFVSFISRTCEAKHKQGEKNPMEAHMHASDEFNARF
jgi:hypothetical protein